jgi:hypothetical protein
VAPLVAGAETEPNGDKLIPKGWVLLEAGLIPKAWVLFSEIQSSRHDTLRRILENAA